MQLPCQGTCRRPWEIYHASRHDLNRRKQGWNGEQQSQFFIFSLLNNLSVLPLLQDRPSGTVDIIICIGHTPVYKETESSHHIIMTCPHHNRLRYSDPCAALLDSRYYSVLMENLRRLGLKYRERKEYNCGHRGVRWRPVSLHQTYPGFIGKASFNMLGLPFTKPPGGGCADLVLVTCSGYFYPL